MITWQSTNKEVFSTLGERLRATRIAAGMSQRRLAESCGVSIPVISRMENGDGGVKVGTWVDALRAIGQLQNLNLVLPEIRPTPYDFVESVYPQRQRAQRSDKAKKDIKWKWGE